MELCDRVFRDLENVLELYATNAMWLLHTKKLSIHVEVTTSNLSDF